MKLPALKGGGSALRQCFAAGSRPVKYSGLTGSFRSAIFLAGIESGLTQFTKEEGCMKRIVIVGMLAAVLMILGCAKPKPEDAAKDIVKKQFQSESAVKVDISKLEYKVVNQSDTAAVVKVSGTIKYDGIVELVKENDKWQAKKEKQVVTQIEHTIPK
jgi:hypothetical protein